MEGVLVNSPGFELGGNLNLAGWGTLRPFVRAGVTWRDVDVMTLSARFSGSVSAGLLSVAQSIWGGVKASMRF